MSDEHLALLPIFLPLAGAALALLGKALHAPRASRLLEAAGALIGLALPWAALLALLQPLRSGPVHFYVADWSPVLSIAQRFDGLAWLIDALGFAGAGLAYLYARGEGPRGPLFTSIFLIQTAALAATASTADLFNLFVCLEMLGLSSYVLVASSDKPGALLASFSYLAVSSAAMVVFLFGVYGLYGLTGSLSYEGLAAGLALLPDGGGAAASLSMACIVAAVAIRVAVMPVYGWLPDAHALAPHAVSAVLSGVLTKTPLFALGRLLAFLPEGARAMELVGSAGALTALAAVIVALSQKDAKRLLAYHSISQIGYIVAAWGSGSPEALRAAYLHALFHALFKGLLFMSVGSITDAAGNRDVYSLRGAAAALRRAGDRRRVVTVGCAVGALSVCALPPVNGFASKQAVSYLFKGEWTYWVLFAAGVGTVASFAKLSLIFLPADRVTRSLAATAPEEALAKEPVSVRGEASPPVRISAQAKASLAALAALCLGTGVFSSRLADFAGALLGAEARATSYDPSELLKAALATALGLGLGALALARPGKRLAALVRRRPRSFSGLVYAFLAGLAALAYSLAGP